jgi:uncharacterized delta-60 repeat protein
MNKNLRVIFLLFFILLSFAQAQDTLWTRRHNTGRDEFPYAGTIDRQGNIIVVGAIGTFSGGIPDSASMYVVKYDLNGNFLWARTYRCANYFNTALGVTTDSFGNIIAAGFYLDLNDPLSITHYELIKTRPNGDTIWTRRSPINLQDYLYRVTLDQDENIISVGGNYSSEHGDILLVKFSPAGNQIWRRTDSLGEDADVYGVALDQFGNIFASGTIISSTEDFDFITVKCFPSGSIMWSRRYNINGFDEARDIALDTQGNIIVTGTTSDYTNYDILTIKYSSSGNLVWAKIFNRTVDDEASGITTDSNNNIYVCGETGSETNHDYLIIKYNPQGETIWTKTYDGGYDDVVSDVKLTAQNDIIVFGASANSQNYDFLTIKYRGSSGIEDFNNNLNSQNEDFNLKFNSPTIKQQRISLDVYKPGNYKIELYNSLGALVKTIHQGYLHKGNYDFALDKYQNGIYFLFIENEQNKLSRKIILLN